ncbi:hypothetical protein ABH944_001190 [Caballeronia udeis]|jgi:hypothetical protein|uniref:Transposase n=1 Tax=Caballeronia udeis TaxID=1232866 RepID=A0ABW8MCH2_9BURK
MLEVAIPALHLYTVSSGKTLISRGHIVQHHAGIAPRRDGLQGHRLTPVPVAVPAAISISSSRQLIRRVMQLDSTLPIDADRTAHRCDRIVELLCHVERSEAFVVRQLCVAVKLCSPHEGGFQINNLIEQGRRNIKSRINAMLGFKRLRSAATTIFRASSGSAARNSILFSAMPLHFYVDAHSF